MTRPTERAPTATVGLADDEVGDWIEARERAALLFWDESDERSRRFRARLEVVAASTSMDLATVNVREQPLVAQALGISHVPSVVVFRGGEVVERILGAPPDDILREALA